MGLKNKMMKGMMDNMSAKEKEDMMNAMMEQFFADMSTEEKQGMMQGMMDNFFKTMSEEEKQNMMQDMMGNMMGGDGPGGMMMRMMGGNRTDSAEAEMPWDMCKKMMSSMHESVETARYATPELRQIFEEWLQQIEDEVLSYIKSVKSIDLKEIAAHFKLSTESVTYILTELAKKGKVKFQPEN